MKSQLAAGANDEDLMTFFFRSSGEDVSYMEDLRKRLRYVARACDFFVSTHWRAEVPLRSVSKLSQTHLRASASLRSGWRPPPKNLVDTNPLLGVLCRQTRRPWHSSFSRKRKKYNGYACSRNSTNRYVQPH